MSWCSSSRTKRRLRNFWTPAGPVQGRRTLPPKRARKAELTRERLKLPREYAAYQITKNGLALQLTLQGTKYYKDDDLNKTAKS